MSSSASCSVVVGVQVDHLGRQLMRGAADGEEVAQQREGLLQELSAAQQVGTHHYQEGCWVC